VSGPARPPPGDAPAEPGPAGTGAAGAGPAGAGRIERLRSAGPEALARLAAARPRFRAVDAAWELWDRDRSKAATLLAGALVYRLFVWLLPVSLLIASLLGFLAQHDVGAPADLAREGGVSSYLVSAVADAAEQSRSSRWITLIVALFGMAVAGSGTVRALRLSHALVWDVDLPRLRRAWAGPLALLGVTILAGAMTTLTWKLRDASPGLGLGAVLVSSLAVGAVWWLASWLLPHDGAPWWALIPGALLGGVGVLAMHLVTVYYLAAKIESASEMYGSLGAAATVLLWLYLLARLIIVAAGLNATLWHRRRRDRPAREPAAAAAPALTVWRFPTPDGAERAAGALAGLGPGDGPVLDDAATVSWAPGAERPTTRRLAGDTGAGALGGAFWGLLFGVVFFVPLLGAAAGALAGALADVGVDDDFVAAVRRDVTPGTSALFVVTGGGSLDRWHEALADLQPELLRSRGVSPEVVAG
jgi:uncharacterized membrane protein